MTDQQKKGRSRKWLIITGSVGLLAALGCALVVWFVLRTPTPTVSASMQQTAAQALLDPASASIELGYNYPDWYPPNGTDYAVESGIVIFPQPGRSNRIQAVFDDVSPDKYMQALVFAPDGRTLPMNISPREDRGWFYIGEWELYSCAPIGDQPHWWLCMLVVGGNI
jgi:hypothetical protein